RPGLHHMDGREAEGFLRFRHDALGDIGRIRRQQQFISAITAKLKDPAILFKVQPLLQAGGKYILTDMSLDELASLALFARDLNRSGVEVATVPGHPSMNSPVSYWIIDPKAAEDVLNRMIVGLDMEENVSPVAEAQPSVGILYTASHQGELQG